MEPVAASASASVAAFRPFAKGASASLSPSQAQSFGWGGGEGGQKDAGISPPRKAEGIVCHPPKASIPFPDSGRGKEEGGASIAFIFPSQRFLDGKSAVWQAVERRHGHNTQTNSGGGGGGRRREGAGNLYASFFSVRGGHREEPPKWLLLPFPSPLLIATSLGIMGAKEEDRGGDKSFFLLRDILLLALSPPSCRFHTHTIGRRKEGGGKLFISWGVIAN